MARFSKFFRTTVALIVCFGMATPPAHAGAAVVFDPINYIENIVTALASLRQEALQTSQLAQLVQQVLTAKNQFEQMKLDAKRMQRSLKGMRPEEILGLAKNMGPEFALYADLNDRVQRTSSNLRLVSDQYRQMESYGAYMNWSVQDVFVQEKLRNSNAKSVDRGFLGNIGRTVDAINRDIVQINRLREAIPDTQEDDMQSLRKAMENVSVHLNLIAGQNTQVLSLLAEDMYSKRSQQVGDRSIKDQTDWKGFYKSWDDYYRALQLKNMSDQRYRELWNLPGAR